MSAPAATKSGSLPIMAFGALGLIGMIFTMKKR
jgi:hypothetical protein